MGDGQGPVGHGELGVDGDGLLHRGDGLGPAVAQLETPALDIILERVGGGRDRLARFHGEIVDDLGPGQAEGLFDLAGELADLGDDVVFVVGDELGDGGASAEGRILEIGRDDDRLAGFDEAARQDVRGPGEGGDPRDVLGGVCGGIDQVEAPEDRDHLAARDDADIFRLGKLGKEQLGDGIAPIVGQLAARIVLERQDGEDRLDETGREGRRLGRDDGAPDGECDERGSRRRRGRGGAGGRGGGRGV